MIKPYSLEVSGVDIKRPKWWQFWKNTEITYEFEFKKTRMIGEYDDANTFREAVKDVENE